MNLELPHSSAVWHGKHLSLATRSPRLDCSAV